MLVAFATDSPQLVIHSRRDDIDPEEKVPGYHFRKGKNKTRVHGLEVSVK